MARLQRGQNPSIQTRRWTDSQVDRTRPRQNRELKEPVVGTIIRGQNVMWPDSMVDKIQIDKHLGGQTPKYTETKVSGIQIGQNQL